MCCAHGYGMLQNDEESIGWFIASSDQGFCMAQSILAFHRYSGINVSEDEEEAVRLYRLATAQQHAAAWTGLGRIFMYREHAHSEAIECFRKAALLSPQALSYIAECYRQDHSFCCCA
jgi:hypothetical protein